MSTDQSRAPPRLESIVAVATANAIYHCKSSDYSTEWLLMIHSSDSVPAARVTGIYWKRIVLIFMSVQQTARIRSIQRTSEEPRQSLLPLFIMQGVFFLIAVEI